MGVARIEYRALECCIEVARQSAIVYKVGVVPTSFIERTRILLKYIATQFYSF